MRRPLRNLSTYANWVADSTLRGLSHLRRLGAKQANNLLDLLFPPQCVLCGAELPSNTEYQLCDDCRSEFSMPDRSLCDVCALPLTPTLVCSSCAKRSYRFRETRALSTYCGRPREAILKMKQIGQEPIPLALGQLLADHILGRPFAVAADFLVPVPTHWLKRLQRGGNPPELICESLGAKLRLPVMSNLVRYRRRTRKQGTLLPSERFHNLRQAFQLVRSQRVAGANVLLVDDVMTTGATANALTRLLLSGGAKSVRVAVVARATGQY